MLFVIPYPVIDPVAVQLGPLAIRWYALAYIAGLLIGWRYCMALAQKPPQLVRPQDVDDFLVWATLGVVLGGRIGYVLFYRPDYYFANPSEIYKVWHGGMSFHGGLLGVLVALFLFSRRRKLPMLSLSDIIACAVPIGLFFGRIANFINDELWGRQTNVWWAMIFPSDPLHVPRYPSELIEATLEGIVLFFVLYFLQRNRWVRRQCGMLTGAFCIGYAIARIVSETFREPDIAIFACDQANTPCFLFGGLTMGMILSIPVLLVGLFLVWYAWPKRQRA